MVLSFSVDKKKWACITLNLCRAVAWYVNRFSLVKQYLKLRHCLSYQPWRKYKCGGELSWISNQ